ncbi:hypothetical protein CPJCM30710_05870 [Clostridium polyendosporum]|uniref:PRC-barrel domain-containing protein n=1 Tax=Clostridium polyendosporum TaxID=69208 RepID=A0A919RX06_9CLOT|nr:PRC-barrel domain-containing protein [Clostridium polyendosporum]GIM27921.1 hypothetical protein CPJCM30710_05870 [Clostridium polyendosporum]
MLRRKDFDYINVYNITGKKLGTIKDIIFDYYKSKVIGFQITTKGFSKNNYVPVESVISFNEAMIVTSTMQHNGLSFSAIKDMDVVDKCGNMIGVVEDVLIDIYDFSLKGIIISSGFIDRLIRGKSIILINHTILGEDSILFFANSSIILKSMPHNLIKDRYYEKV